MSPVLVDSNVLLDLSTRDTAWGQWSRAAVRTLADRAVLVINPIIYAEISADFARIEHVDDTFPPSAFRREPLPYEAAFLAAKCHRDYRRRGGMQLSVLPGFLIGAHAAIRGYQLLTRDARRYRTYFPRLSLVTPE
jgi:predicted nucleic acid-binding protein